MAFKTKKMVVTGTDTSQKPKSTISINLSQDELNILLQLIRNSNFNGDMIERLYHLTSKLQHKYIENKGE
tara:strand:+ start:411 stop:620 length:210 start_codon:yes stop_codon:yes gene_type:complete